MTLNQPETLFEAPGLYRLLRHADGRLELEVVCGTIGVHEVRKILSEDEAARVRDFGEYAARAMALRVARTGKAE